MKETGESWGDKLRLLNGNPSLGDAANMAHFVMEERLAAQAALVPLNLAVKEAVSADRASFEIRRSQGVAREAEFGLSPAVHRKI